MQGQNKYIRRWLWSGAVLIFLMTIIGGITRLTGSGLSMTDWNLIMGAIPPMNEPEWMAVFEQYKQFPQYQQLNVGMTLTEFKEIFFWEYLHRLWGRMIGVVFILPFLFFWVRGYFNRRTLRQALLLLALGMLQAGMGWFMVKSGLVGVPYVSHYRLAFHLLLAFLIAGSCIWFALGLDKRQSRRVMNDALDLKKWAIAAGIVLGIQITWGAFTAGLHAGYIYNTFPMMGGWWIPPNAWLMQPLIINFFENPETVQWFHRLNGTVLALLIAGLWLKTLKSDITPSLKTKMHVLLALVLTQYLLGVLTLLFYVPIALGVAHQAVAMLLWFAWLAYYRDLKNCFFHNHKITLNNNRYEIFRKSKYRTNRSRRLPNSTDLP